MQTNSEEINQINIWLEDKSFLNWAGQTNQEDINKWEHHFVLHPEDRATAEMAKDIYLGIEFKAIPKEKERQERVYANLMNKIERRTQKGRNRNRWSIAAAIAVLMILSSVLYFRYDFNKEIIIATNYSESIERLLPDSSLVTLNANSELRYYKNQPRKVYLKGEAFFNVKKRPQTQEQFQVLTNDLTISVLGTSFNVNSRQERTKVFLEEGIVQLAIPVKQQERDTIIEMNPGDLVTYSKKEKILASEIVKDGKVSSWKDGTMEYKKTLLPQILENMRAIYGVDLYLINEQLAKRSITIALPNDNLEVALETLQDILGVKVQKVEEQTYLLGE
ncbi:MAG: FecR domain-containing protein [Bacteroidota bacterium]